MIPIYTFVTDPDAYLEMRRSFEEAGFTGERATYVQLSGIDGEGSEPYSTITRLIGSVDAPFVVLCHQDIRPDQGHGIDELLSAVRDLETRDERWAVAGNAGGSRSLRVVRRIVDPHGGSSGDPLPVPVHSLDENLLIVRTGTGVRCSPGLTGFHLYGTDLCLNALEAGCRCYVIDFLVRHISPGTKDSGYAAARDRLVAHWSARRAACYVRTTVEVLFLSRRRVLRMLLGFPRLRKVLKNHASLARVASVLAVDREA
jgi:hypothetical protein